MPTIRSYRDLEVWKRGIELAAAIHRFIRSLPKVEQYAIGDQLIGSAISIPANIAEGYGRRRSAEYLRFLDIANASRCELETRLEVCVRVELISREASNDLLSQSEIVGRMLTRLRLRINQTRR